MESAASAHADGLYAAAFRARPTQRTVDVQYGSMIAHVEVQRRLSPALVRMYSTSNENDRYYVLATVRGASENVALVVGGRVVAASGSSVGRSETVVHFRVDRADAERIGSLFVIARNDRAEVGAQLSGRFSLERTRYVAGESVRVQLTVSNPAQGPQTQWQVGGRQRGPRDNRFRFRVWRDGALLAERPGADFGGPTGFTPIAAGASASMSAELSSWAELSQPGRYRVECSYETQLAPDGAAPFTPADNHRVWDRRFEGVVEFELTASRDRSTGR